VKKGPAARERRRVVKNKTLVDATRISPRREEVHADDNVGQPTHALHPVDAAGPDASDHSPNRIIEFDVELTQRDIIEAVRLGLTSAQMLERCVKRALQELENAAARKLAQRRRRGVRR